MTVEAVSGQAAAAQTRRADLVGIGAMIAGTSLLVVNDTFVKLASETLPLSEVIVLRALLACALLFAMTWGALPVGRSWPRFTPTLLLRLILETATSCFYLYALLVVPIGDLNALQQVVPLLVLAGAALVLRERIGWRGWIASAVGLGGALLIVQPGQTSLAMTALVLVLGSIVFAVARDLITRTLPVDAPSAYVAGTSQLGMIAGGLLLGWQDRWTVPEMRVAVWIAAAAVLLALANTCMVVAMRTGRIGVVGAFRYAGLLAALVAGWLVWGEFPDRLALIGSAVIVAAGVASSWRRV